MWAVMKKGPWFVGRHVFLFFLLFLAIEVFLGFRLYQKFCFVNPEAGTGSSFRFQNRDFESAVKKMEKEEKILEQVSEKDYFSLFRPKKEPPSAEKEVD